MPNKHGDFVWYELMTPDADASQEFYGALLGWKINNPANDGMDYREIQMGDAYIGGMLGMTADMIAGGAHPGWIGYIHVDNVDASIASITAAGGTLCMPATDLEGVGRFAMMLDPQGAPFYIMTSSTGLTSEAFSKDAPRNGHCAWNELATNDQAAALAFYSDQFGWVKSDEMDMGPMGKYEFLRHEYMLGALMTKPPHVPNAGWNFYFRVANIDDAATLINAKGGKILHGPQEIPSGYFTINALDPQGASFAIVGAR